MYLDDLKHVNIVRYVQWIQESKNMVTLGTLKLDQ